LHLEVLLAFQGRDLRIAGEEYRVELDGFLQRLPPDWQVGYIAIGAAVTRPVSIGHDCALAERYDRTGVAQALKTAGYSAGSGGGFGMLRIPTASSCSCFNRRPDSSRRPCRHRWPVEGPCLTPPAVSPR
jgi:hypothetical protein